MPRYYVAAVCLTLTLLLQTTHPLQATAGTLITDSFDLGVWSPLMTRVQKSVPVCIWNADQQSSTFKVTINSSSGGSRLGITNEVDDLIPYRVHWLSGKNFRQRERLSAGRLSTRSYTSDDTARCASGPTGMLRITVNARRLSEAPAGRYTDTLQLTVSPL